MLLKIQHVQCQLVFCRRRHHHHRHFITSYFFYRFITPFLSYIFTICINMFVSIDIRLKLQDSIKSICLTLNKQTL